MKQLIWSGAVAALVLGASGCATVASLPFKGTVDAEVGQVALAGLSAPVSVKRDTYGVPLVEAKTDDDLAFALGYVMATDRLTQMVSFSLAAQGRLSEMAGPVTRDVDIYMRTLGLRRIAEKQLAEASPRMRRLLEKYAAGVNAYLFTHQDKLPLDFKLSGYQPEPWSPVNSMDVFTLLNMGLSLNLQEELGFLSLAAKVGPEKAAWLIPSYPGEALRFSEAAKLADLPLQDLSAQISTQRQAQTLLGELLPLRQAASNNWAIAPSRTLKGASILANDTHLMLEHPPVWMLLQVRSPGFKAGGVAVAGIPGLVAGYNGNIAWGMTMVMADTQDLFVEKLKVEAGKTLALYQGLWEPVQEREELLRIKGQPDYRFVVQETRHGPLLGNSLKGRRISLAQPVGPILPEGLGLALQTTGQQADKSMERFLMLGQARAFAEAEQALKGIGFINLNVLLADKYNIAWQVTGHYPQRKQGQGYFPSPGWTGDYDWQGYVPYAQLPQRMNPEAGFLATANHRTVEPGDSAAPYLTGSWYAPERHERIQQRLAEHAQHTLNSSVELQADVQDLTAPKLQALLKGQDAAIKAAIAALPESARQSALQAQELLMRFDGDMEAESAGAAFYGIFLHEFTRNTFLDELGPEAAPSWQAFLAANAITYSAWQDHLLARDDSPFWDDVRTEMKETKPVILARTLVGAWQSAQRQLGRDTAQWQWGKLHTYEWSTATSRLRPFLPFAERQALNALAKLTDRGPYPAPGSTNTVNVAGYTVGQDYRVWNVPAMRMVVDFGLVEPLHIVIAGGQSGNPVSPHFDNGIPLYLSGKNRSMAFHNPALLAEQFNKALALVPAGAAE